jgi:hypothetical protein
MVERRESQNVRHGEASDCWPLKTGLSGWSSSEEPDGRHLKRTVEMEWGVLTRTVTNVVPQIAYSLYVSERACSFVL